MKIIEVLEDRMSFSFEVFPPKTDKGMENLKAAMKHYYEFKPDFISCTYGSGGSNAGRNAEVCEVLKKDGVTEVMTHFTCIGNSSEKPGSALDIEKPGSALDIGHIRRCEKPGSALDIGHIRSCSATRMEN